jgi:hypothetical protein
MNGPEALQESIAKLLPRRSWGSGMIAADLEAV